MPLVSFSGAQAYANLRADRLSLWPDGRRDRTRLSGVASVGFKPSFTLKRGEAVFTAGSCFARNIEQRFSDLGFDVPATRLSLPPEERASDTGNDFLNKYPPQAILNEMRWALEPGAAYPQDGLFDLGDGLWHDPHLAPNLKPASLERVLERRALVTELYRQIPSCRIIVLTLGLVEAWFDEQTGYYLNGAPPAPVLARQPDRFRLDVLTVQEVEQSLKKISDLLSAYGQRKSRTLLTVSPVPMRNTFTGEDAISANAYSKAVMRVAAQSFARRKRVDYFPSYEIITHTSRSSAYIQDNRHVTPQAVKVIVDRVVEAYCPQLAPKPKAAPSAAYPKAATVMNALKTGDFAKAADLLADLGQRDDYVQAGFDEFTYRFEYGRTLLRLGSAAEAQAQLAAAVAAKPTSSDAIYQLARALARLQRPLDAEQAFRRAAELNPASVDIRLGLANQLSESGRFDEAEAEVQAVLAAHPEEAKAHTLGATIRNRREEAAEKAAAAAGPLAKRL
ncbi:MAG: hypothetical protein B7Y99_03145 [Caulobacterales bacterium 32-69-10]|nr:MAG: hypothetical protein B7Y99_03145 [Caulobacterales bacterium 32-69-10]